MKPMLLATVAIVGMGGIPAPALAQQVQEAGSNIGIQDIVVTAQRREENSQKAALSIAVLAADTLRAQGVAKVDDLTRLTPGVQASGGTTTQVYVRGIGDFGVLATANPAVVTNLDGVAIARPQAISGNMYDLERVEVLKGPQGTLYGRNASGGAVNILTAQPKYGQNSGYVEGNFGNYSQFGAEGAVNLAVGQETAFRASFQVNSREGYLTDGTDDDKHQSVRLQIKSNAITDLTVRVEGGYTHLGGNGTGFAPVLRQPGVSPWLGATSTQAGSIYLATAQAIFTATGGQSVPPALLANPANTAHFQDVNNWYVQGQFDYDAGFATVTFQPAYREVRSRYSLQPSFAFNLGGAYNSAGDTTDGDHSKQYSLELRLGNQSSALKWVLGANYFHEALSSAYALQGGLVLNAITSTDFTTKAGAVFGQATYSLTDRLRVTGGLRYTSDQRNAENYKLFAISPMVLGLAPSPADCVPANGKALGSLCPLFNPTPGFYNSKVTFNRATWKAGLEFDIAPKSLAFVDVSSGFKAGGFSQGVDFAPNNNRLSSFAPERVVAYTVGVKNRFMNNRLQVNAEAFYLDYRDLQISSQAVDGDGAIALFTQNAGKAHVAGFDLDVLAKPWTGGTLHGAVEYIDSKYDSFSLTEAAQFVPPGRVACPVSAPNAQGLVQVDCSGKPLLRAPKWSGAVGLTQEFPIEGGASVVLNGDMSFSGAYYFKNDFIAAERQGGYALFSASLTYNAPSKQWFVSGFIRNLTNQAVYTGGGGEQAGFVQGYVTSNIMPPRTYGMRAGVKF